MAGKRKRRIGDPYEGQENRKTRKEPLMVCCDRDLFLQLRAAALLAHTSLDALVAIGLENVLGRVREEVGRAESEEALKLAAEPGDVGPDPWVSELADSE
ncbi:MAG: hypothetical protein HYX75_08880 [Acidobacteria bacterium]|nr:hypothetical protein [Acidobacteriota bacterium]